MFTSIIALLLIVEAVVFIYFLKVFRKKESKKRKKGKVFHHKLCHIPTQLLKHMSTRKKESRGTSR